MCLILIPDLLPTPKRVFLELTEVRQVPTFGGATYAMPEGVQNPWFAAYYVGVVLLVLFVADASITLWRRGERHRAALIGGTIVCTMLFAGGHGYPIEVGILKTPYLVTLTWLFVLAAMAWGLSSDQLRAMELSADLRKSQGRMQLATKATELGVWEWNIPRNDIWATEEAGALYGVSSEEPVDIQRFSKPCTRTTASRPTC